MSTRANAIRLLLCEDQTLMRQGLRTILELEDDFEIVGEAVNGKDAVQQYQTFKQQERGADVVLMDIQMPVMNGVEATASITTWHAEARIIMLTTFDYEDYVFEALKAGAVGYQLKDVPAGELANTIRKVHAGEPVIQPALASRLLVEFGRKGRLASPFAPSIVDTHAGVKISTNASPGAPSPLAQTTPFGEMLSSREIEVLKLFATGASNREIADKLVLAEGTVKNHVSNILSKLHADNRTQAANMARKHGLI